ncbi:MAG: hypothetical protein QF903_00505 [Planctomycetota bacterium]|jgi:hypothetical protein|nr:hypothetical protein [Planctomycetota bacterium]MDP6987940.1 hypothetical protein [Planctomycetota bacterium]
MKNTLITVALATLGIPASGSDLVLSVESGGAHQVTVSPGETVDFTITGVLSDTNNRGLAMFAFDLDFDGGALAQVTNPGTPETLNFASPLGINNPAGYGGTLIGGDLIQVGGAQNTIKQGFAPQPTGTVIVDVGHSSLLLASGSLTAPASSGVYTLEVENIFANVIRGGTSAADPFWHVVPAGGQASELEITVVACDASNYCTAKQNSQGCTPAMGSTGTPSLSGPDDFHVTASNMINNANGIMFWGLAPASTPFGGGTLCVSPPIVRTAVQNSGGTPAPTIDCTGSYSHHFSQADMQAAGLGIGNTFYAQQWQRDVTHPDGTGTGLSDGLAVTVCP